MSRLVLLVGDHGFRASRARNSVATVLAARLPARLANGPDRVVVLDRTANAGSRAVVDLALDSLVDLDRLRARFDSADLFVTMNVADGVSAGCNPFDWVARWLRIETTARALGWEPTLVWLSVAEDAPKETRRFEKRVAKALVQAGVEPIRVEQIEWRDSHDVGSLGTAHIAEAIKRDLDLDATIPVVVRQIDRSVSAG